MFGTLGNSFKLLSVSWNVLKNDRELVLFPLMAGGALFFVFAYTAVALWAGGTLDRIGPDYSFNLADFIFLALAYFLASFVVVYFTAALAAASYQRLEGFSADLQTGFAAANDRLGALGGWSAIAATVALALDQLSDSRSLLGRLFGFALRMLWGYSTFFVVPVMVIESAGPLDALGRSTELFRQNWGRTVVSNFGFGVAYVVVALLALGPAALLYFGLGSTFLSILVGAALMTFGFATIKALETIFLVALYDFAATGRIGGGFSDSMVRDAYVAKESRGRFRRDYGEQAPANYRRAA
jgi:Family of unknown function (DUF6159)